MHLSNRFTNCNSHHSALLLWSSFTCSSKYPWKLRECNQLRLNFWYVGRFSFNEYETAPYFIKFSHNLTYDCWLISVFSPKLPELNLKVVCTDVKFWLNWIKYGAVSYSLSCMTYARVLMQKLFKNCLHLLYFTFVIVVPLRLLVFGIFSGATNYYFFNISSVSMKLVIIRCRNSLLHINKKISSNVNSRGLKLFL